MKYVFSYFGFFGIVLLCGVSNGFAATILDTSSHIFADAYRIEKESSEQYYRDATKDISKKYNTAVQQSPEFSRLLDTCGGCDLFSPDFDTWVASTLPGLDDGGIDVTQIAPFINPQVGYLKAEDLGSLHDFMLPSLQDVREQVDFQVTFQKDLDSPGKYMDNDKKNSPFDLMDDQEKIARIFMKDPPKYEGYTNTMKDDARGLITGRFETGNWAQGQNYEIDLASDIASALGQKKGTSSGGESKSGSGADCEDGFCITLDIISNDSYSTSNRGGAFVDANFEEIFGSATDWLIKRGDKRNLACKTPPPTNHFQSNNDLNLFFKNIFRGLGIFVFTKTPPYAKSKIGSRSERTPLQKEKDTDDVIKSSLKNYNIDPAHLMLGTIRQSVQGTAPQASTYEQTAQNQKEALRKYQDYLKAKENGGSIERKAIGTRVNALIKNDGRIIKSQADGLGAVVSNVGSSMKAYDNKGECQT